jgi:hypothetical protein
MPHPAEPLTERPREGAFEYEHELHKDRQRREARYAGADRDNPGRCGVPGQILNANEGFPELLRGAGGGPAMEPPEHARWEAAV